MFRLKDEKMIVEVIEGGGVGWVICLLCFFFGFVIKIVCVVDFLYVFVMCLVELGYG